MKLVLLPGMDGTGQLFRDFIAALPATIQTQVVEYPRDQVCSYDELLLLVEAALPAYEPFVLLAESFSTPLAIHYAASCPTLLKGLILCAGFAASPVTGALSLLFKSLATVVFRLPLGDWTITKFLVGNGAPGSLVAAVQSAVASVSPAVMAARLREILSCNVQSSVAALGLPTLELQALGDRLVGPDSLKMLKSQPLAQSVLIDGPHLLLQREPRLCATIVAGFVQRVLH